MWFFAVLATRLGGCGKRSGPGCSLGRDVTAAGRRGRLVESSGTLIWVESSGTLVWVESSGTIVCGLARFVWQLPTLMLDATLDTAD